MLVYLEISEMNVEINSIPLPHFMNEALIEMIVMC